MHRYLPCGIYLAQARREVPPALQDSFEGLPSVMYTIRVAVHRWFFNQKLKMRWDH